MTAAGKRFSEAEQPALFDLTNPSRLLKPKPGSLGMAQQVRVVLSDGLRASPLSRCQIAERMSELTGEEITKNKLDLWTAPGKRSHRFPLEYSAAFISITGKRELLALQAGPAGYHVIESADMVLLELARVEVEKRKLAKQEKDLKALLGRVNGRRGDG